MRLRNSVAPMFGTGPAGKGRAEAKACAQERVACIDVFGSRLRPAGRAERAVRPAARTARVEARLVRLVSRERTRPVASPPSKKEPHHV